MAKRRRSARPVSVASSPRGSLTQLPALLTVAEFQRATRISRTTAYQLLRDGAVPALRFGRTLRIPREALQMAPASPSR